jgi:RecB family exonuclease
MVAGLVGSGVGVVGTPATGSAPAAPKKKLEERRLWRVSPSQVDQFRKCPRTWYNGYVLQDRAPTPPFMARGTAIHSALEHYLKTGEVLVEVEVKDAPGIKWPTMEFVQAAIPHIPKPLKDPFWDEWRSGEKAGAAGLMLEQEGEMATWPDPGDGSGAGPTWVQYIDLVEAFPDWAQITDYKTTSDFRYCKTPAELAEHVQMTSNAKWLFSISDYKTIKLRHLNLLTAKNRRPKANPVFTEVSRDQVEEAWAKTLVTIREMCAWAKLAPETADPLPPNTDHCGAYGGCYYRAKCGLNPKASVVNIRKPPGAVVTKGGNGTMGILDEMMKSAQKIDPAKAAPPPAAPTPPPIAPPAAAMGGLAALLGGGAVAAPPAPPAAPKVEPLTPETAQAAAVAAGYPAEFTAPTGIVPPDAPPAESTAEEIAAANPPKATPSGAAPVEGEEKPKRGRKKKGEAEAAAAATPIVAAPPAVPVVLPNVQTVAQSAVLNPAVVVVADTAPAAEAPGVSAEVEKARQILNTPDTNFECGVEILFIDTLPAKGWPGEQPRDLLEFMHAFNNLAATSAGAVDYRLIRYESKGYLATAVRVFMKGLPKAIFVDSRMPGADIFMETVIPYCKMVFRGVR